MPAAMHFWVSGRVQHVYFRANTKARADELGLRGWVRNVNDGRVEGVACGEPAELAQLKQWLAQGPERAQVSHLEVQPETPADYKGFDIR